MFKGACIDKFMVMGSGNWRSGNEVVGTKLYLKHCDCAPFWVEIIKGEMDVHCKCGYNIRCIGDDIISIIKGSEVDSDNSPKETPLLYRREGNNTGLPEDIMNEIRYTDFDQELLSSPNSTSTGREGEKFRIKSRLVKSDNSCEKALELLSNAIRLQVEVMAHTKKLKGVDKKVFKRTLEVHTELTKLVYLRKGAKDIE